jgi:hypothetical protein
VTKGSRLDSRQGQRLLSTEIGPALPDYTAYVYAFIILSYLAICSVHRYVEPVGTEDNLALCSRKGAPRDVLRRSIPEVGRACCTFTCTRYLAPVNVRPGVGSPDTLWSVPIENELVSFQKMQNFGHHAASRKAALVRWTRHVAS